MYLAIGPHGWAKAERADDALQRCIGQIAYWEGYDKVPFHIFRCDDSAWVNEMGDLCYDRSGQKPTKWIEQNIPPHVIRAYKDALAELDCDEDVEVKYFDSEGNPEE